MKDKRWMLYAAIALTTIFLFAVVSYFEYTENLWGLSLLLWIAGAICLLVAIAKEIKKGIKSLQEEFSAEDVFCAIGTIAIVVAFVLAPLFVNGFNSFHIWDAYSTSAMDKDFGTFAFNYCITTVAAGAALLVLFPICGIAFALPITILGHMFLGKSGKEMSHSGSNAGLICALFAHAFILLSQLCGAVDYFEYLGIVRLFMD